MDRRTALKALAAVPLAILLPQAQAISVPAPLPAPSFYSPKELAHIYGWLRGHMPQVVSEIVKLREPDWSGRELPPHALVHLAICRMRNIMHYRTRNTESRMWMAISSKTADADVWHKVENCDYTTPGKPGGEWVWKSWRDRKPVEVVPGVWRVCVLNSVTPLYVAEGFLNNVLMCGVGCREVVRYRQEGVETINLGMRGELKEHVVPKMVPYMGRPTLKHFGLIGLVG